MAQTIKIRKGRATKVIRMGMLDSYLKRGWHPANQKTDQQKEPVAASVPSQIKARLATKIGRRAYSHNENGHTHYKDFSLEATDWDGVQVCDSCGKDFEPIYFGFKWDTPSGTLEPGCLYWEDLHDEKHYWENHSGPILMAVLPNGNHWGIDSRASNCTMKQNRTHRCWVRHYTYLTAEGTDIHVDKNGETCSAGAGSILSGDYHGFLHHGHFSQS